MPIYKRCSRCGKRLEAGKICECVKQRYKEYDRCSRDKQSKRYYDSAEWEHIRRQVLDKDDGIDVYIYMTEGRIVAADTVHHIIPLKDCWDKRNDIDNLMSLHHDTHSTIESLYKKDKQQIQKDLITMLINYRRDRDV